MQAGVSQILSRTLEVLREEGPRSLLFKALGETVYRRLWIIEREPGKTALVDQCRLGVECRPLEASQIEAYLRLRPEARAAEIAQRLEAGHNCFAVWLGDRIVNARWIGAGRCRIEYLDFDVELSPDAVYLYETFTAADLRGRRVTSAGVAYLDAWLRRNGVRRMLAAIGPENQAVFRSAERGGFRRAGKVGYVGVGAARYRFCRYQGSARPIRVAGS